MTFKFGNLEGLGSRISIEIPRDDQGFIGRECPLDTCLGYFKVKPGTGLPGSDIPCHCPYCGHIAPGNHFFTKDQIEYGKSVALRKVADAVIKDLKTLEFESKPKGPFGIGLSMTVRPGPPLPISHYREQALETHITCESCTLDYAVYGVFAYCPDCGEHNSLAMLFRNIAVTRKQINLARDLDDSDLRRQVLEDALENCVSAFDGFGREACRIRAAKSRNPSRAQALSFQNLTNAARQVQELFDVDWRARVGSATFGVAQLGFMRRHLIAHKAGVIDHKYVEETHDPTAKIGRRLRLEAREVEALADCVERLAASLAELLPAC